MKLSWLNTSMSTHKQYLAYEYVQYKVMQDIREIELRDSGSNTNNKICFEVRATTLYPRLHTEGFSVCPHRTFNKGTSTEELQLYTWNTLLLSQTQSPLHKRNRHKAKAKKRWQSWWSNDHKQHLVITIDHKQFSS